MVADYRSQNQLLLAKVESVSGTEETPTVGADAVKAAGLQPSPNFELLDTDDEHTGSIDAGAPIVGGGGLGLGFSVYMRGSGAAGTAPEWGPLMRGCAMAETVTAAAVTGTAQAGAASTLTLAAGASATDDAYKGMVMRLTAGTASGESNVITGYVGSTKVATVARAWTVTPDATSEYSIDANVLYKAASDSLETLTLWAYQHSSGGGQSLLRRLIGAAGNANFEITNRGLGRMSFDYTGILPGLPTNVANPGAATFDDVRAEAFKQAEVLLGGNPVKFNRFTLDLGNEVGQADDPAATYGLDVAGVTRRKVTGSINPLLALLSTRNNMSDFMNGTEQTMVVRWGLTAGRRISLLMPTIRITNTTPGDIDGFASEEIPFQAVGADDGIYMCVH